MQKSEGLKLWLLKYKETPPKERTYQQLKDVFQRWLNDEREEQNLARERTALEGITQKPKGRAATTTGDEDGGTSGGRKSRRQRNRVATVFMRDGTTPVDCHYCHGNHFQKDCKKKENDEKAEAAKKKKQAAKGNDPKGKGKGKGEEQEGGKARPAPHSIKEKCLFYQKQFNGGFTCHFPDTCTRLHIMCKNQAEYDKLCRDQAKAKGEPKGKGAGKKGDSGKRIDTPKTSPRAFAAGANWGTFCKLCTDCPGRPDGGTGECKKIHCTEVTTNSIITNWKETQKKEKEKSKKAKQ